MSGKTLKLIQLISKRDQGVASFKETILSETFTPASQSSPAKSLSSFGLASRWRQRP